MSVQPDTDQQLAKTSGKLAANGAKLFAAAAVLAVIGALLLLTDASTVAGLFCVGLAVPVTIGGLMLTGSGAVGRRASQQKDFA